MSFSIELNTKNFINRFSMPDGSGDRLVVEGTLGKITRVDLLEDIMVEISGENGSIRVELSRSEIERLLNSENTRALVAYHSMTGNTKKIAETIFEAIDCRKSICPLNEVKDLMGYDIIFLGFPMIKGGMPRIVQDFIKKHGLGRTFSFFVTHGARPDLPELQVWLQNCIDSVKDIHLLEVFHCQGEISDDVAEMMKTSENPYIRRFAEKAPLTKGKPDQESLTSAKKFTEEIMQIIED